MHALLAHLYHLVLRPFWHAPAAAFAAAAVLRLAMPRAGFAAAAAAVLAGWLADRTPVLTISPAQPLDRLAGLAVLLLLYGWCASWRFALPALAAGASWWIGGAPADAIGLASCVPIFLVVWAALAVTRRAAVADTGWAATGASVALAACLFAAGVAPHWVRAALVPAWAGAALLGMAGAALPLAAAVTLVGCLAAFASNRFGFVPADLALAAPLLVWTGARWLAARRRYAAPWVACVATLAGAGVTLGMIALWSMR